MNKKIEPHRYLPVLERMANKDTRFFIVYLKQ